jgi:hypothetical protein
MDSEFVMGSMDAMFTRSLADFTDALGVENAPSIVYLSLIPWPSDDERVDFIKSLTGISMREVLSHES